VSNQYGVELLNPEVFSFITLGEISRVYNAPNPFNPQKGENTRIFFEMPQNGSAQLDIYSEYGDKIKTISLNNLLQGSNEISYDGRDANGKMLYNGTYLCVLKKKYAGQTKTEKCRLLIIK
jgi:flagellar hook assembly protein FlgD